MAFRIDEFKKTAAGALDKTARTLYATFGFTIDIAAGVTGFVYIKGLTATRTTEINNTADRTTKVNLTAVG